MGMFSKEARAKRKANREAANALYHEKMKAIDEKYDAKMAEIRGLQKENKNVFHQKMQANNEMLKEAWKK